MSPSRLLARGFPSAAHFDNTFSRNVKGTLFTVQTALPLLGQGSSVILTGSTHWLRHTFAKAAPLTGH